MPLPRRCTAALAAGVLVLSLPASSLADEARDALIVETILRIEGFDLQGSAKAQAAVARYLKSNWAGERYLDLIERFTLKEEAPGVLRLALEKSDTPMGAEAAALLVTLGAGDLLIKTLHSEDDTRATRAAVAISHTGAPALVAELPKILADQSRAVAVRSAALSALYGKHPAKQAELLAIVKAGKLAKDLHQIASEILMLSRDPGVREEARSLFAVGQGNFPPVVELVKRKGNAANGKQLFATKTCLVCHQAGGGGINFGPGLSEIGDKLDKNALYQAILEPSAGISMGFEGWEVTLKDKSTLVGIVVETDEDLTVTMIGGAKRTINKGEVSTRKKLKQSLMYPGLHQLMTPDELVDLVEYLSSLRKAG
ncbi:MAG: hypothetical protein CMN05_02585 [Roseibacillus sp.]|nr:hypothetical protein [Roseibacillus sp.]